MFNKSNYKSKPLFCALIWGIILSKNMCFVLLYNFCSKYSLPDKYKEPSIISGTGAVIWSKSNFGTNVHHHPRNSALLRVCTIPSASALLNSTLKSCVVPAILPLSLHLYQNCGFSVLSSTGETERSKMSGGGHSCWFW
jgi:hypothetical protein